MGWIGVDFDGTLAEHCQGDLSLGKPIPKMMERVKAWVADFKDVRIMTARAHNAGKLDADGQITLIQKWCVSHGLPRLPVTCSKDYMMYELWDDRAVHVKCNTGISHRDTIEELQSLVSDVALTWDTLKDLVEPVAGDIPQVLWDWMSELKFGDASSPHVQALAVVSELIRAKSRVKELEVKLEKRGLS